MFAADRLSSLIAKDLAHHALKDFVYFPPELGRQTEDGLRIAVAWLAWALNDAYAAACVEFVMDA